MGFNTRINLPAKISSNDYLEALKRNDGEEINICEPETVAILKDIEEQDSDLEKKIKEFSLLENPHDFLKEKIDPIFAFFLSIPSDIKVPLSLDEEKIPSHLNTLFDQLLNINDTNLLSQSQLMRQRLTEFKNKVYHGFQLHEELNKSLKITPSKEKKQILDAFSQKLVKDLESNGTCWLPLRKRSNGMPTLLLHIDRNNGSVTIVNDNNDLEKISGENDTVNHKKILKSQLKKGSNEYENVIVDQKFLKISHIDKNKFKDPIFFQALLEYSTAPLSTDEDDLTFGIYKNISSYLEGRIEKQLDPKKHPEAYLKMTGNTNGFQIIFNSLYYSLLNVHSSKEKIDVRGREFFKQLKFLSKAKGFVSLFELLSNLHTFGVPIGRKPLELIEQIIRNYAQALEKRNETKNNHSQFEKQALDIINDLKNKIEEIKEKKTAATDTSIPFNATVNTSSSNPTVIPVQQAAKSGTLNFSVGSYYYQDPSDNLISQIQTTTLPALNTPETAASTLNEWVKIINDIHHNIEANSRNNFTCEIAVQKMMKQIVSLLPVPDRSEDSFWSKIPQKHKVECLKHLNSLMSNYTNSFTDYHSNKPEDIVNIHLLLAITDKIARTFPEAKLNDFTTVNQNLLSFLRNPRFICTDPNVQSKMFLLMQYFIPDFNIEQTKKKESVNYSKSYQDKLNESVFILPLTDDVSYAIPYNKQDKKLHPTLKYYSQFLHDPNIIQKLNEKQISISDPLPKIVAALANNSEDWISPSTHYLQQASMYSHAFSTQNNKKLPKNVQFIFSDEEPSNPSHSHQLTAAFSTDKSSQRKKSTSLYFTNRNSQQQTTYSTTSTYHSYDSFSWIGDNKKDLSNHIEVTSQNEINAKLSSGLQSTSTLSPEIQKDFKMIEIDPYDAANRAIEFARHHISDLKTPIILETLRYHIFRTGTLTSQLEDYPQFANRIAAFTKEAIGHYKELGDIQTALRIVDFCKELQNFVNTLGYTSNPPFPDFRKYLIEELLPLAENDEERLGIYKTRFLLHRDLKIDQLQQKDILKDLCEDLMSVTIFKQTSTANLKQETDSTVNNSASSEKNKRNSFFRSYEQIYSPLVRDALNKHPILKDEILNSLIKIVNPQAKPSTFTGTYPTFANGEYRINCYTGEIETGSGQVFVSLPTRIASDPLLSLVCPGTISYVTRNSYNSYSIFPQNVEIIDTVSNTQYFRTIDGVKYLLDQSALQIIQNTVPASLFHGSKSWLLWSNTQDPKKLIIKNEKNETVYEVQLQDNPSTSQANELLLHKQMNCFYNRLQSITRISDGKKYTAFHSLDSSWKMLEKIANPKSISVWYNNDDNSIAEINLPEVCLDFNVKNINGITKAFCKQCSGYYLSNNQNIEGISSSKHYLVLENDLGNKKVLLPFSQFNTNNANQNTPTSKQTTDDNSISATSRDFEKTWIDVDFKDQLCSDRLDGNLYLAYLEITKDKYVEAAEIIKKCKNLDRYKEKEEKLLRHILKTLENKKETEVAALFLTIIAQIKENYLKNPLPFNKKETFEFPSLMGYYLYYLNNQNNSRVKLTKHQEQIILYLIQKEAGLKIENFKTAKNWKEVLMKKFAEVDFIHLQEMISDRWNYLQTDKKTYGVKVIHRQGKIKESEALAPKDIELTFISSEKNSSNPQNFKLIDSTGNEYDSNFFYNYKKARHGSKQDRKDLLKKISLNRHIISPRNKTYQKIIESVCKRPNSYPTVDKLKHAIDEASKASNELTQGYSIPKQRKQLKQEATKQRLFASIINRSVRGQTIKFLFSIIKNIFKISITFLFKKIKNYNFSRNIKKLEERIKRTNHRLPWQAGRLEEIDKSFNNYFETTLNKYFSIEEKNVHVDEVPLPQPSNANANTQSIFNNVQENLQEYREKLKQEKVLKITPQDNNSLSNLHKDLKQQYDYWQKRQKIQLTAMLAWANAPSKNLPDKDKKLLRKIANSKKITVQMLHKLYCNNDIEEFLKHTLLDRKQIEDLFTSYSSWQVIETRVAQIKTTLDITTKLIKLSSAQNHQQEQEALLMQICKMLKQRRAYSLHKANAQQELSYEAANGYFNRKEQVDKCEEMLDTTHRVKLFQMETGFGKTNNVIPRTNAQIAHNNSKINDINKRKLILNIWPASQENINTHTVDSQSKKSFHKPVNRIYFDRYTFFDQQSLQTLWDDIKLSIYKGTSINMRPETIQALEHHTKLELRNYGKASSKDKAELEPRLTLFIKILRAVGTRGTAFIDEADSVLNPFDQLVYTGDESEHVPLLHVEWSQGIFKELLKEPFASKLNLQKSGECPVQPKEFDAFYETQIAPQLAEIYVKKLNIEEKYKQSFLEYVLGNKQSDSSLLPKEKNIKFKNVPKWIQNHPQSQEIYFLKGQLIALLPDTLKSSVNINCGLSHIHIDSIEYAIPYVSSDIPKENPIRPSEYKPHPTINKTYRCYLYHGLKARQIHKLFDFLKKQAMQEIANGTSLEDTQACLFFKKIAPDVKKPLNKLNNNDIDALIPFLSKNADIIFYYITNIIRSQIKFHPETLVLTSQNHLSMYAESISTTATPQPTSSHGPNTHFIPMQGVNGKVCHLLLTKTKNPQTIHITEALDGKAIIEDAVDIAKQQKNIHASIDVGGLLKDLNNFESAKLLCEKLKDNPDIEAVMFFDTEEQVFKIMEKDSGVIHDPASCILDPAKQHTYFDKMRSYGSDVKLATLASALLFLGKSTTLPEAGQAAGRMRQLAEEQGIEWLIQKALAEDIFGSDGNADPGKIMLFLIENLADVEAYKNYLCQKQQIDNEIYRPAMKKVIGIPIIEKLDKDGNPIIPDLDAPVDVAAAAKTFSACMDSVMITKESLDPSDLYANITEKIDPVDDWKEMVNSRVAKTNRMKIFTKTEKNHIKKRLNSYESKWQNILKPQYVRGKTTELNVETETLQEQHVETQVSTQQQIQHAILKREPWLWPEDMDIFKRGWEKPSQFSFYQGLIGLIRKVGHVVSLPFRKTVDFTRFTFTKSTIAGISLLPIALPILFANLVIALPISIPAWLLKRFSKHLKGNNHTRKFSDIFSKHMNGKFKKLSKMFGSNLLATNNFITLRTSAWDEPKQKPFGIEQKPFHEILVIQDTSGKKNKITVVAIDQNDSTYLRRKLKKDVEKTDEKTAKQKNLKIAIYDLSEGIVAQGKNQFLDGELEHNKDFLYALTEAKVVKGCLDYDDQQIKIINDKIRQVGKKTIYDYFVNVALAGKPSKLNLLSIKPIGKLIAPDRGVSATAA